MEPTILEKLRQMSAIPVEAPITGYPDWFQETYKEIAKHFLFRGILYKRQMSWSRCKGSMVDCLEGWLMGNGSKRVPDV